MKEQLYFCKVLEILRCLSVVTVLYLLLLYLCICLRNSYVKYYDIYITNTLYDILLKPGHIFIFLLPSATQTEFLEVSNLAKSCSLYAV